MPPQPPYLPGRDPRSLAAAKAASTPASSQSGGTGTGTAGSGKSKGGGEAGTDSKSSHIRSGPLVEPCVSALAELSSDDDIALDRADRYTSVLTPSTRDTLESASHGGGSSPRDRLVQQLAAAEGGVETGDLMKVLTTLRAEGKPATADINQFLMSKWRPSKSGSYKIDLQDVQPLVDYSPLEPELLDVESRRVLGSLVVASSAADPSAPPSVSHPRRSPQPSSKASPSVAAAVPDATADGLEPEVKPVDLPQSSPSSSSSSSTSSSSSSSSSVDPKQEPLYIRAMTPAGALQLPMPRSLSNRKLEDYRQHLVFVQRSKIHGCGIAAGRRYESGELVVDFHGRHVCATDASELAVLTCKAVGEFRTCLFQVRRNLYLDASVTPTIGRTVNHSCAPNCLALSLPLRAEGRARYIALFAKREIPAGEEITFDYNAAQPAEDCLCGSKQCRKRF
eukprot:Selendium_serpulae@DN2683_c0_g1_i1.p1